jgi:hypothetical protein
MTMTLIESKVLSSAAASIEFTSIPQDGTDLVLLISGRSSRSGQIRDELFVGFNNNTSGYTLRALRGNGSTTDSNTNGSSTYFGRMDMPAASATSNTFSNISVYIPNYAGSTNKSISGDSVMENNATESWQQIVAGLWSNTAAITSIQLKPEVANFEAGTTVSLYKITKGSDGIVTTS